MSNDADPQSLAAHLVENAPYKAISLYKLLVWAQTINGDPQRESQMDQIEEFLFSKTEESARHRALFRQSLEGKPKLTSVGP